MLMRNCGLGRVALVLLGLCGAVQREAPAAPVTWIGGNVDWLDGSGTANWSPADEPDTDDTAIFNSANTVNLGSDNSILALTLSGGIDLLTNNFDLTINGLVQLSDAGTNLFVGGTDSFLAADSITVNNAADLELDGGAIQIIEETGTGLLDINVGGEVVGYGFLTMSDGVGAGTTLIVNDGAITARRNALILFGTPPAGTLTVATTDVDARTDLDGASETGVVNVLRNQTLVLNTTLADAFGGTITMTHNATLDMANPWTINTGTINADNGLIAGVFPNPDIPAGVSTITGATLTQTGGTINVVDTDGTLQFDAPFSMLGGTFDNQGHTIFNANASINNPAVFTMGFSGSDLTVGPNAVVTITQTSFNLDGNTAGTVIAVNQGAFLTLNLGDYDNDSATNAFDGTITLNDGAINVTTADAEFVMDGVLNMHSTAAGLTAWEGEPLDIGNDAGTLDADLNVTGANGGQAQFNAPVDFNSDADVNVAAGGILTFLTASTVNFNTVNGANNAEFTGTGTILFSGQVNVNEAVTLNLVGGTVDLDGADNTGEFINIDAPLTIIAATLTNFGRANGGGTNTLDINNSVGTGVLTVNLDDANAEWTLNGPGVMNLVNDNTDATLLAGSDVNLNGTVNVTGDVRLDARVDIAGVVNINTAGQPLRLSGGDTADTNTLLGGAISGLGLLGADTATALHGFGTINTGIDFDGTSNLRASGGTLTLNGAITDVNILGTADDTGTLNIPNAWALGANVAAVVLAGGVLQGGTITNDNVNGLQGHGTITARVVNNTQILAGNGGTLVVQTAGNDNDWDGTTNTGMLRAVSADLELRDAGAAFGFTGSVLADNGYEVFTNGFALDFNPGSILSLDDGSRYHATSSTDLGGTVTIGAGAPSTLQVANNFFLTFEPTSATTLNADLALLNNNIIIEAGATFAGTGALIVPAGSHLVMEPNSNANVLLLMDGTFRPGNFDGVGRVDLRDYQQTGDGNLFIELTGTALNQFDRLVVNGAAQLDGLLLVDIDGGFVPALGNTFNIISATGGVSGTFSEIQTSGLPAGRTVQVNYTPTLVQLQVVPIVPLALDFDQNGYVNHVDLQFLAQCYTGPAIPGPAVGCALVWHQAADSDDDNDVDQDDFGRFQRCYTGAALITNPNCAN